MWERLRSTKTLKVVIGGLLVAIGGFLCDQISMADLVEAILVAITAIFLRDGIAKGPTPGPS